MTQPYEEVVVAWKGSLMTFKKLFSDELERQRVEIARVTLQEAFRGGLPAGTKMSDLIDELKGDDLLWSVFKGLRFEEFKEMLVPTPIEAPGPSRKRGKTAGYILDYIRANPGARRGQIMAALGLKGGTVSSQLRNLCKRGQLRTEGKERDYRYFVTSVQ